jgi:hypothetical protein
MSNFPTENIFSPKRKRRGQNGSPNHVPQGLTSLRRKGFSLMQKSLSENFQKTSPRIKLLSKSNIFYIVRKLLKCKYQK